MTRYDRRMQLLAAGLAALAGYVDASGFIASGGFFVSFMSGNSTRMGIGVAQGVVSGALAAGIIAVFICGVVVGALAGQAAGTGRSFVVLALVAVVLGASAAAGALGVVPAAVALMAMAMGLVNNVFERKVSVGLTYMTGSLVKLGQGIAGSLQGDSHAEWITYLLFWLSFVCGVLLGAVAYPHLGLRGLWGGALVAAVLAQVTRCRSFRLLSE
ncbi:YoaK family protein [Acidisoma cladoniae]|uniref:YoaK family protein n=1 Tax=Acidisoma cladoniae TaxID=3040935 RepID=UPI0025519B5B|nr:DUF1275 family protein [Acidisoma sp. PAMC 29798]